MKILWTVNILFPEAKALLENRTSLFASSGGWLMGAAEALCRRDGIELHIACPANVPNTMTLQGKKICYHLFPGLQPCGEPFYGDNPELDSVFSNLIDWLRPDLIDIHGTEYAHSLSCLRAAGDIPCVVTLQGLLYECAEHYHDGLSKWTIISHKRLFKKGIFHEEALFRSRAEVEKKLLSKVRHFIGRTEWDKECALSMSPEADYYVCNETLRDAFYEGKWSWEGCEKHSIFLSQGSYPLKGLHQMLRALPAVLKKYPDTVLYIGGEDIVACRRKHRSNYARIIAALLRRHSLSRHVFFTGALDTLAMKERFMKANVFVCPSSIENSSNSLGEAQILGVPCVASKRGGNPTTIPSPEMGALYDFDDTAALAKCIIDIFGAGSAFDNTAMREMALRRHDQALNAATLENIYRELLKDE